MSSRNQAHPGDRYTPKLYLGFMQEDQTSKTLNTVNWLKSQPASPISPSLLFTCFIIGHIQSVWAMNHNSQYIFSNWFLQIQNHLTYYICKTCFNFKIFTIENITKINLHKYNYMRMSSNTFTEKNTL